MSFVSHLDVTFSCYIYPHPITQISGEYMDKKEALRGPRIVYRV